MGVKLEVIEHIEKKKSCMDNYPIHETQLKLTK